MMSSHLAFGRINWAAQDDTTPLLLEVLVTTIATDFCAGLPRVCTLAPKKVDAVAAACEAEEAPSGTRTEAQVRRS